MATRALIGYLDSDNLKLTSTYNHYDGYPENLGVGLEKFYSNDSKAEEIANVGYISSLNNETGEWEATNKARPKVINLPNNFNEAMMEIAEQIDSVGASYGYIWDNDNEEWITIDNAGIRSMMIDLEMSLAHLKEKFSMLPDQPDQTMNESYTDATNNELASYISILQNQIGGEKNPKKLEMLKQDLKDVKLELEKRKSTKENSHYVTNEEADEDARMNEDYQKRLWQHRAGIIK